MFAVSECAGGGGAEGGKKERERKTHTHARMKAFPTIEAALATRYAYGVYERRARPTGRRPKKSWKRPRVDMVIWYIKTLDRAKKTRSLSIIVYQPPRSPYAQSDIAVPQTKYKKPFHNPTISTVAGPIDLVFPFPFFFYASARSMSASSSPSSSLSSSSSSSPSSNPVSALPFSY